MTAVLDNPKLPLLPKLTGDGSYTLFVPGLGEHYHSIYGAVTESMHVFISAGYRFVNPGKNHVLILEIGFGTGLNALLTWKAVKENKMKVSYCALEPYPLPLETCSRLNYTALPDASSDDPDFLRLHECSWDQWCHLDDGFSLLKIQDRIQDYLPEKESFDLVYFDAFAPEVQPEMWSSEVFEKIHRALKPGGIIVTYSTKGEVKRTLKSVGFSTEKLPGPPGKREMLRAYKQ